MIVVTGANGNLGRAVIQQLVERVPASDVVAIVRDKAKAEDLAALGVEVREADYSRPETLSKALLGADKVLLISSSEIGQRVQQHSAVVDAAKDAGVQLIAYTSILNADRSTLVLAQEHKATEAYIRESGLPFVLLRNGWYLENQTGALAPAVEHGAILGAAGDGRFAAAARSDYAGAAVAVLTTDGHAGRIYELAGDEPYTLEQLASKVSQHTGKPVIYKRLSESEYATALASFGLPEPVAKAVADADRGAANGELDSSSSDLRTLLGKPTTSLSTAIEAALQAA